MLAQQKGELCRGPRPRHTVAQATQSPAAGRSASSQLSPPFRWEVARGVVHFLPQTRLGLEARLGAGHSVT